MVLQYTPHLLPLSLAVLLAVVGGSQAWRRRKGSVEVWGTLAQLGSGGWILTMLLLVSFTGRVPKEISLYLYLPSAVGVAMSFFIFTVHFTGRSQLLTRRRLLLLLAFPALTFVVSITNRFHHLFYDNIDVVDSGSTKELVYTLEPAFYVPVLITYAFCTLFLVFLLQHIRRSRNVYRKIGIVLFVSLFVLVGVSVFSMARRSPLPHFMLFPYAYLVLSGFLIAGTTSIRFLRILPVEQLLAPFRRGDEDQILTARATVMEEIDSGIITLDGDGVVVDINTMAKKMIGAARPIGSHIGEVAPTERIKSDTTIRSVLDNGGTLKELSEEIWVDADDEERCYAVTMSSLADDEDEAGYVVLLHDITAQKRREQALKERERELEQQNERLERQKKQLEHQNERLDRFAGIVSHDLRNPLNVAKGHVDFMADQVDAKEETAIDSKNIDQALKSLDRMEAIIDDALTLARQGKAITETESVDLGELIEASWENVDTASATIEYPTEVTVNADSGRLRNVFENLFRNSIEHGHDEVQITVELLDDGFAIEDDGPGIPEDRQDQVFEEGFTTRDEGTGFGLAIVSDVIRAHGWDVTVTTGSDSGARFEVTGVEFPWSTDTLTDKLDDVVESETAERTIQEAMDETGLKRDKFDKKTGISLLETVSDRLPDQRAASAASDLAQQLRETTG